MRPSDTARRDLGAALAIVLVFVFSVAVRWPGFTQGGFASHDVGGILYNAMVLHRGGLPYVDTVEFKAPGSFYVAAALAGPEGRDIAALQIAANVAGLLSLVAVAAIAWRQFGARAAVVAASLYALHDAFLDSMDANYVTWANLPQLLCIAAALEASKARGRARRLDLAWWCASGVMAGLATLMKQPAGVILAVALCWAGSSGGGPDWRGRVAWRPAIAVGLGFVAAHLPIVLHYASRSELGALVDGYLLNKWSSSYLAARQEPWWSELWEGAMASSFFLGLPLLLAGHALFASRRGDRPPAWLLLWLLAALLSASLGFRFYKGYFLAVAAPLCLVAAAPWGLLGARCRLTARWRALALVPALLLVLRQGWLIDDARDDRGRPHDEGARVIADHVVANTSPGDTIWVWGWHLWGVYALSGRSSASPLYKSLGLLTPPNDDTWRRPASRLHFVDGPPARRLMDDLRAAPPAYVVIGSSVPHREFTALREFLREHYRQDRRVQLGRVQFWQRRAPAAVAEP